MSHDPHKSHDGVSVLRRRTLKIDGRPSAVVVLVEARHGAWFLVGDEFGVSLAVKAWSASHALDVYDEHFGERVSPYDVDLTDYGPSPDKALTRALEVGDARYNDGGTLVWANPHEHLCEVPPSAARRRTCRRAYA